MSVGTVVWGVGKGSGGDRQPAAVHSRTWPPLQETACFWFSQDQKRFLIKFLGPLGKRREPPVSSSLVGGYLKPCPARAVLRPFKRVSQYDIQSQLALDFAELQTLVGGFFYEQQCVFQLVV